jgi:alkyldihydroxyacetonephosphate synthase|tara:strand:- start:5866 stop:7278 length:1413 start_codon:yes stop_codon:yes gene_type:complete
LENFGRSTNACIEEIRDALGHRDAVSTSQEELLAHSHDWWPLNAPLKHQGKTLFKPEIVAYPKTTEDVVAILGTASKNNIAVTPWGLGSSVVGGPLPTEGGIVLNLAGMDRVIDINTRDMHVTVEAGINGGLLEDMLQEQGLTMNHSPQSLYRSSVGGWLSTRATGQFSSRYGGIEDLCVGFKAVLPNGQIVQIRGAPRMAVGPDLRHVLIGSEGCLGVITEVTMRLFPKAEKRLFQTVVFPDIPSGIDAMRAIMTAGLKPFLLRFYDLAEARHAMNDPNFKDPVMFLATEGCAAMAETELDESLRLCANHEGRALGPAGAQRWMGRRFDFSTIENALDLKGGVAETIEVAHTWSGIGKTYVALTEALAKYSDEVLGHFSHAYTDGVSLYVILLGKTSSPVEAEQRIRDIWDTAMRVTLDNGAVISHHHGTGLARANFVSEALGTAWPLYGQIKKTIDPKSIMNPGKLGH